MLRFSLKRGEITFSTIVMAVIALAVLFVLIMIFTGKMGGITKEIDSCRGKGGICSAELCNSDSMPKYGEFSDCNRDEICCIKVFNTQNEDETE